MKYVYVDVGAYDGDSIKSFLERKDLMLPPFLFEIYAIEPNPKFHEKLIALPYPNLRIDTSAAWINDEEREFAVDGTDTPMGSTLMPGKKAIWDKFEKIKVQCFDFSEWIKQFQHDYLIVKLDVEGAEFPILKKMIEDGTDRFVDQLWVEMHPNKVNEYSSEDSQRLLSMLHCPHEQWS